VAVVVAHSYGGLLSFSLSIYDELVAIIISLLLLGFLVLLGLCMIIRRVLMSGVIIKGSSCPYRIMNGGGSSSMISILRHSRFVASTTILQ
jgi:hypothetical protein